MNPSSTRRVLNQATLSRGGSKGEGKTLEIPIVVSIDKHGN